MLPPSRERAVCFEEKVACVARFEWAYSYPDVRRLFSGSWSGTGADCHLNWATETILECEGPRTVSLPADAYGIG